MVTFKTKEGEEIEVPDDAVATVKINRKQQEMTSADILRNVSKGVGADEKLQEAAQIRKEGEVGKRIQALGVAAEPPTPEGDAAFRELGELLELDDEEIDGRLQAFRADQANAEDGEGGDGADDDEGLPPVNGGGSPKGRRASPRVGGLSKEEKAKLETAHADTMRRNAEKAAQEMRAVVDKDERLGALTDAQKDRVVEKIMKPAVVSRLQAGQEYGPELLKASLEDTSEEAKGLGILPEKEPEVVAREQMLEKAGVGLGPSAAGGDLGEAIQTGKPPERVSAADPGYEESFVARALLEEAGGVIDAANSKDGK